MYNLLIVPYDIEKYWKRLPLLTRILSFCEVYGWGPHLTVGISKLMDIDPRTLHGKVTAALDEYRRSRLERERGQAGSVPSLGKA